MWLPVVMVVAAALTGWFITPRAKAVRTTIVGWFVIVVLLFVTWSAWEAEDEPLFFLLSAVVFGIVLVAVTAGASIVRSPRAR